MAECKTAVTPLLIHWSYCYLAISHRLPEAILTKIADTINVLIHKQLEMHGCIPSAVATDALVPKHQATSTHSAD